MRCQNFSLARNVLLIILPSFLLLYFLLVETYVWETSFKFGYSIWVEQQPILNSTIFNKTLAKHSLSSNKSKSFIQESEMKYLQIPILYHRARVPVVYRNDRVAFEKYKRYLSLEEEELPLQTKVVFVVTHYRSGSSFFGELFNQHPDVFYSFEPLIGTQTGEHCTAGRLASRILGPLAQCIIPNWEQIYRETMPGSSFTKQVMGQRLLYTCARRKFCFPENTKELCRDEHCPRSTLTKKPHSCLTDCGKLNLNLVTNECRRKKLVVIKLIRLCDIRDLEFLVTKLSLDVKVLQLIRDPRGIAFSRHKLDRGANLRSSLAWTCARQRKNAILGLNVKPAWLAGRYKMFRYEDVALHPYKMTREAYDFVGLNFTDDIKRWILMNTGHPYPDFANESRDSTEANPAAESDLNIADLQQDLDKERNPWSHKRHSEKVVEKWKAYLPHGVVWNVQHVCRDIMHIGGYKSVDEPLHYANKSNSYLLDKDVNLPIMSFT